MKIDISNDIEDYSTNVFAECLNRVNVLTTTSLTTNQTFHWSLGDCSNNLTLGNQQNYSTSCCLNNGNYTLNCTNGGDGNFIEIQGKKYCKETTDGEMLEEVDIKGIVLELIINR